MNHSVWKCLLIIHLEFRRLKNGQSYSYKSQKLGSLEEFYENFGKCLVTFPKYTENLRSWDTELQGEFYNYEITYLYVYLYQVWSSSIFYILKKEWSLTWLKIKRAMPPSSPYNYLTTSLCLAWRLLLGKLIRCAWHCAHLSAVLRWLQYPQAAGSSSQSEFVCRSLKFTELLLRAASGNREKKTPLENIRKVISLHSKISRKAHLIVSMYKHVPFDLFH